ncbi:MAG TPA: hypothetical protein VH062_35240 [Polyangiaceae bacterium]|jgi:hypothetical protein|nr:hypothetical protein [Polyangiaceae bacterium]
MEVAELVNEFLSSEHGQQAASALGAQGVSPDDAQTYLTHAATAAHEQATEHHGGRNFFAAFAAGLVRGDGFLKSLIDGGEGVLSGRIAEAIASRAGVDPSTASAIAATATPFIVGYLKQKLG